MGLLKKNPWGRIPGESAKAFNMFCTYLSLGPERSLRGTALSSGHSERYISTLKRWSTTNRWVERATEYDTAELEKGIEERAGQIERARNIAVRYQVDAIETLVDMLTDPKSSASAKLGAAREILDRGGLVAPKRYELSSPKGSPISVQVGEFAESLSDQQLAELVSSLSGMVCADG